MTLQLKYPIPLDGAKQQGTRRATRRHCALTAALAAMARQDPITVVGKVENLVDVLSAEFLRLGVPVARAALWAQGINGEKAELDVPEELNGLRLSDYQRGAISTLGVAGGILALDTGLGKTLCTTAAALGYAKRGYNNRCYILAPVNAMGAWDAYLPVLKESFKEVAVYSIDSLHKAQGLDSALGGVCITDELHLLGVETAQRTKYAHDLRKCFDVGIGLTGTLLTGGVEKALSALDLAIPGSSLFSSSWTAGDHFECLARKEVPGRGIVTSFEKPSKQNVGRFHDYLARHVVSVKKYNAVAKEAEIPEQTLETVKLDEPWGSLDSYVVAAVKQYMEDNDGKIPQMSWVLPQLRREGLKKKLQWLENFVQSHPDEPLVIAAWSKESLEVIRDAEFLRSHVYVDGSITGPKRKEAVRQFQAGEVQYYIGQLDASCVSVNLFRARYSITLELTNRASNYEQYLGRTARRGQQQCCTHYDVVTNPAQQRILTALRAGVNFDASFADYIEMKETLSGLSNSKA